MKTSTKFFLALFVVSIVLAVFWPGFSLLSGLCFAILLIKGLMSAHDSAERTHHDADVKKVKDAGGTDTEALLYASLEKQRRAAWIQTAAQMKNK